MFPMLDEPELLGPFLRSPVFRIPATDKIIYQAIAQPEGDWQLLVFVNYQDPKQIDAKDRYLVERLISWKEASVPAQHVAFVCCADRQYKLHQLQTEVPCTRWLSFGVQPGQLGLHITPALNRIISLCGIRMVFTYPMQQLAADESLKRKFFLECYKPLIHGLDLRKS